MLLGIRLFCRSEYTKYFDAEIACFGSLLELLEYIHSFVSVFYKNRYHLYEINVFPLDKNLFFCVSYEVYQQYNREISLHVQRRVRVDVGLVFGVKIHPYLKIKYTFEIFH